MTQPSKFISNSDFASTPSSLLPPKHLILTPPSSFEVQALVPTVFSSSATFPRDFDSFVAYLWMDNEPEMLINGQIKVLDTANGWIKVEMRNSRTVVLRAVYSQFWDTTVTNNHTFHAVVVPILSPYKAQ